MSFMNKGMQPKKQRKYLYIIVCLVIVSFLFSIISYAFV